MRATGRVPAGALRDLLEAAPRANIAFRSGDAIQAMPVALRFRAGRYWIGVPRTPPAVPPLAGQQHGGSFGPPGGSAMAHCQQARAGGWTRFARSLPWRLAAVVAAGALAGTLTHGAGPRLAGPAALACLGETRMECSG